MRRKWQHVLRAWDRLPRFLPMLLVMLALGAVAWYATRSLEIVTVQDEDGRTQMLLTGSSDAQQLVQLAGFTTGAHDEVLYKEEEGEVFIKRSFEATLLADGTTATREVREGTVADLLAANNVVLDEHDYTEPALDTPLYAGAVASVHRVHYTEEVRREDVSEEELQAYVQSLPEGTEFVESTNGPTYDVVYQDKILDGLVVESKVVEMIPIIEALAPRPADSYEFTAGVPNSRIESFGDIEVGPDGLPLNYVRVWEGAVCTAYSASRGRGSSGLGLYCGTAAVNPNVIPYGTRMWITSADGSFVYGYCVATDTGTAMMEGHVDLDLFFETNAEARRFGKRQLNVYILDGNIRDLEEEMIVRAEPAEAAEE